MEPISTGPALSDLEALLCTARMLYGVRQRARLSQVGKYLLRAIASWSTAAQWAQRVLSDARLLELARQDHFLLFRVQRPYLRATLRSETKLSWLQDHFRWLWQHWPPEAVRAWYGGCPRFLVELGEGGLGCYRLQLRLSGGRYCKEGELALEFEQGGVILMTAVFAVHQHEGELVIDIGCVQGMAGQSAVDRMRRATRDLHGLRPRQVVLCGLHAIARHYGIRKILGVPGEMHVSQARSRTRGRVSADYNSFWKEMGGVRKGDHYVLDSPPVRRLATEIDARKRAQYRRRYALEDNLYATVAANLPELRSGGSYKSEAPVLSPERA